MKNLFEDATVAEIAARIDTLSPASQRIWGRMSPAQAVAHCAVVMETAVGERRPRRLLIGRLLGPLFLNTVLGEKPMGRNSPTDPTMAIVDDRTLDRERERLKDLIVRFHLGGPAACTTHPHSFFGALTQQQWARLMFKHIDHHLQQFGA